MNSYSKGENVSFAKETIEETVSELQATFPDLINDASKVMMVKNGSKLKNLINVAVQQVDTNLNYTIISGFGPALGKVISLAEIVKRRSKSEIVQVNNIRYTTEDEHWVPKEGEEADLDPLKVVRHIPMMTIFLVKSDCVDLSILPSNWTKQTNLEQFLNLENGPKKKKTRVRHGSGHKKKPTKKTKEV